MASGGYRENAGRKKGTLNDSLLAIREEINKQMPASERAALMLSLAKGVLVSELKDGEEKVYRKEPNIKALELAEGYASGKAPQSVYVETDNATDIERTFDPSKLPKDTVFEFIKLIDKIKKQFEPVATSQLSPGNVSQPSQDSAGQAITNSEKQG
jgi:hypothetical protein